MNSVKNRKYSLPLRNQDLHGTEKGALEEEPRKKDKEIMEKSRFPIAYSLRTIEIRLIPIP